jgi:DNA-binding NarL/FixJ family response regulator
MIENQPDMEVVSEIIDPVQLLLALRITMVDVVIVTPLEADEEPRICRHLLAEYPKITVVTLSADGGAAYLYQSDTPRLYIAEPSGQSILNAVR